MSATYVQGITSGTRGASYPKTLTPPGAVTVGNTMLVVFFHSYSGANPTVSDSLGNTYTHDVVNVVYGARCFNVFSAPITTGGSCTVTVACAAGTMIVGYAIEVANITATPFDGSAGTVDSATGTCTAGSITTTAPSDFVLALFCAGDSGNQSFTPTGGASLLLTLAGDGSILQAQTQVAAGSITPSATGAGDIAAFPANGASVAYKAASSGPSKSTIVEAWDMSNHYLEVQRGTTSYTPVDIPLIDGNPASPTFGKPKTGIVASGTTMIYAQDGVGLGANLSSITRSGSTATATTSGGTPHGMTTGQLVTVAGATQTEYNVTAVATVTSSTTFTYPVSGTPATPATTAGTITFAVSAFPQTVTDLASYSQVGAGWSAGGMKENPANPGYYRFDFPNGAIADNGKSSGYLVIKNAGIFDCYVKLSLPPFDPNAQPDIAAAVLDVAASSHNGVGTVGAKINSAASAGDPLTSTVPGTYGAGTAGKVLGDLAGAKTDTAAIKAKTDNLPTDPADESLIIAATTALANAIAALNTLVGGVPAAVLTAATAAPIAANNKKTNDVAMIGTGTDNDPWRAAGT